MLSKEEIETCKEECRKYIECMAKAWDNAGWARGLMWYITKLETKVKELGKGQITLMQSRKKWKSRYYKEKAKGKEVIEDLKEVRHNLEKDGFVGYADEIEDIIQFAEGEKEVCN